MLVPAGDTANLRAAHVGGTAGLMSGNEAVCYMAVFDSTVINTGNSADPIPSIDIGIRKRKILNDSLFTSSGK